MKWLKILFLFSPLFISVLGLLGLSENTSAVTIDSGIYSTAIFTKNYEETKTVVNRGPENSSSVYAFLVNNPTGIWDYTQDLSFTNPYSAKTGTGYQSTLYFTMHSTTGNFLNYNLNSLFANINLGFEGLSEDLPYCTRSYEARVQDYATVQFVITSSCPSGSYPTGTVFNQVESHIDYSPDSIFWCANDNPSRQCPSTFGVTVYDIDYYFGVLEGSASSQDTIINQNQTIINQNQDMINQMEATNDWLTDDTAPSADTSSLGNAAGWLPPGPLDSILNLPVQFIQGIIGVFTNTNTCSPIVLPLGIIDYDLVIPCMRPFFELASVNIVWNTVGTIISAVLIFHTLKWLYKFVDDTLSFRENNSNIWGGL